MHVSVSGRAPASPGDVVSERLRPAGPRYLLQIGTRGSAAWRVIRRRGGLSDRRELHLNGLRAAPIAADGGSALYFLDAEARSVGSGCGVRSYRLLAAELGDAFATLRGRFDGQ